MKNAPLPRQLQVGGTLNPRRHLYIERPEDEELLQLLLAGEFCNVLASRQMGKSSLMARTALRLAERGVRFVAIDVAGELGGAVDPESWYLGLLDKVVRDLKLLVAVEPWWRAISAATPNQRLLRFFREEVAERTDASVVVLLDEIDSTLKLPFTDDLFTALRTIYNERPLVETYNKLTFCLLGVATPNELVKDRRTTAYNVGRTLELRDFDAGRDDLAPLAAVLSEERAEGRAALERVMYWTGGHPYLTLKLCDELQRSKRCGAERVDAYVEETFGHLERLSGDVHFQQILRFLENRIADGYGTFRLYERILEGRAERAEASLIHAQLLLSGLVRKDLRGRLVVRNRLYERLFDRAWVRGAMPERRIGSYRLERKIASPETGAIFHARDLRLDRPVAIKLIPRDVPSSVVLERWWRGARVLASLSHPAIVQIYDVQETEEGVAIVMEWVEGRALRKLLKQGPFEMAQAIDLAQQLAGGLAAIHAKGMIHRDLSPENVMVTPEGRAKILDFGLARQIRASHDEDRLTAAGIVDVRASAPEEVAGSGFDHRYDLFSLGVTLYEIVTGQHPFPGSGPAQIMALLQHRQIPAIEINPTVSSQLSELIDNLLEKDPNRRLQSAEDVLSALATIPSPKIALGVTSEARRVETGALPPATEEPVDHRSKSLQSGDRIGAYVIERRLGAGGMGSVYLAQRGDDFLRRVAIKILHAGKVSEEVVRRFSHEGRVLARLSHPSIAQLYDIGTTDDGRPYFVIELVEGEPLDVYCNHHVLPLKSRLELFCEVCSVVNFAHRSLVIHADLKPSNILVTYAGFPKLLDFGIARLIGPLPEGDEEPTRELLLGTPRYASPEQLRGEALNITTDVYSLGVMLYELLSGRAPFSGDLPLAGFVHAVLTADPPAPSTVIATRDRSEVHRSHGIGPRKLASLLTGDLDAIVMKALRRDPWKRYLSVEEFSADIRRYLEGQPVRAGKRPLRDRLARLLRHLAS